MRLPLIKLFLWLFDKFFRVPGIKNNYHAESLNSFSYLMLSRSLSSLETENSYCFHNSPEKILIHEISSIDLTSSRDTNLKFRILEQKAQNYLLSTKSLFTDVPTYKVATIGKRELITTQNQTIFADEIYRFLEDPVIYFPEIIDLLISDAFRRIFEGRHQNIRFSGVNMRLSQPTSEECHTKAFHRDYNSYYTIKIFIPLLEISTPFLEYFPSSELIGTFLPHYTPRHLAKKSLPKFWKSKQLDFSSTNLSKINFVPTNCIHRERESRETKLTLIVTYSSHPDYGFASIKARKGDLESRIIDKWTRDHLRFICPV